ncbi:MAG TPA: YihY/virulence factor BrkB family protein [Flavisolibacter sp.]|nr:YihY/virulence factor BrkB family protein [Flavisolibacter sp.]
MPRLLSSSLKELLKNDPLRMAGATAFFTTFALPPILVILIQAFKLLIGGRAIRVELFDSLAGIVGPETVRQLIDIMRSMRRLAQNWYVTIGGFIFLLFVATTLFKVIRNSLNQVWKIRPYAKRGLGKKLRSRAQSIAVILIAGVLFIIGIIAEGAQAFIGSYIFELSPLLSVYFNTVLSQIISILIVTVWFTIVFRFLPDGKPRWNIALAGGLLTSLLFAAGKAILHWLLSYSNINTLYGTSASIVLLLLFVFYASLILYYGAAFTKVWGIYRGLPILPRHYAMHYRVTEAEERGSGLGE